jgi:hypothetical protein
MAPTPLIGGTRVGFFSSQCYTTEVILVLTRRGCGVSLHSFEYNTEPRYLAHARVDESAITLTGGDRFRLQATASWAS